MFQSRSGPSETEAVVSALWQTADAFSVDAPRAPLGWPSSKRACGWPTPRGPKSIENRSQQSSHVGLSCTPGAPMGLMKTHAVPRRQSSCAKHFGHVMPIQIEIKQIMVSSEKKSDPRTQVAAFKLHQRGSNTRHV